MNRITLLLIFFSGYMYGQCPPLNNSGWDTDSKDAPSPPGSKTYSYGYADIGGTGEIRNAVAGSIYQLFYQGNCPEQGELYFVIREGRTGPVVGMGVLPVSFYASENTSYFVDIYRDHTCSTSGSYGCNWYVLNCRPSDNCLSPLPISLTSFTASPESNGARISWTTESELDNDYFTLFRSWDGEVWEEITRIKGAGNSKSELNYEYFDRSPVLDEVGYYKLRQTDYDGQYEEFEPISVRHLESNVVSIYPNPVQNTLTVSKKNSFKVFDLTGKEVKIKALTSTDFDVSHLNSGVYILHFDNGEIVKLVKK